MNRQYRESDDVLWETFGVTAIAFSVMFLALAAMVTSDGNASVVFVASGLFLLTLWKWVSWLTR